MQNDMILEDSDTSECDDGASEVLMSGKNRKKLPGIKDNQPTVKTLAVATPSPYNRNMFGKRAVSIRSAADAKRLAARLIRGFQERTIAGQEAKDLMYLVLSYIQIIRDTEIEQRLKKLESSEKNG